MGRYLVFDASCTVCSRLAETVRQVAGEKLEAIDLRDPRAMALLDRAYPGGWAPAPYLIVAGGSHPRAWTGAALAARLALLIGPRGAWRVWAAARRQGGVSPQGARAAPPPGIPRRALLKLAGGAAAALVGLGLLPAATLACAPCESCGFRDVRTFRCVPGSSCWGGRLYLDYYDRYDARFGDYCYSYATGCCGSCCP